jgi:glycine/D-amino acid oxidase-like deaminating enzyme
MNQATDVIVIGAGVVGCSVAYYLASSGAKVTLLEREAIGSGASTHATGSLSILGAEFSQGASFELALAGYREFIDLVPRLESETGANLLYQRRASLRLALDEDEVSLIKGMMEWQWQVVDVKWIDGDDVRRIEPRLSPNIRGAVYENESAQLDSYRLNLSLAQGAERFGAEVVLREVVGLLTDNSRVTGVRTTSGDISADMVVVAAGEWSSVFGDWLGYPVPVRPLKGERLMLKFDGPPLPVLISSPKRGHMISRLDGLLSVGSTGGRDYDQATLFSAKESDTRPTEAAKLELLQRAIDVFPALRDAELVQQLAGSRPLSPDRMPIIGTVPGWDGIMLATGHTTKGIHLGPITGRIIASWILQGRPEVDFDISPFLPDRFADMTETDFRFSGLNVEE